LGKLWAALAASVSSAATNLLRNGVTEAIRLAERFDSVDGARFVPAFGSGAAAAAAAAAAAGLAVICTE
jgi:hypothetical protein